jgi:Leucine rich repeat
MQDEPPEAEPPKRKRHWLLRAPDRLLLILLAIEVVILLAERFRWFGVYLGVWVAFGCIVVATVVATFRPLLRGRRWYQFSLRSLLIFTLMCAVASSWVAHRMEQKRDEQEAVLEIVKKGARDSYDYQFLEFGGFNADAQPPGPEWLQRLLGNNFFGEIESVEFLRDTGSPIVTDADLVHLSVLTKLKTLVLRNLEISDVGLANLEQLTKLRALDLSGTSITDAGLVHIKGLTALTWLDLRGTTVTDAGRAELQKALTGCLLQR